MADRQNFYELYRGTTIGTALADTLDDLISSRRIEPQLAMKIMANFDQAIAQVLNEKVKARMSFKGHLHVYNHVDEVWTFVMKDIKFKMDNSQQVEVQRVKTEYRRPHGSLGISFVVNGFVAYALASMNKEIATASRQGWF